MANQVRGEMVIGEAPESDEELDTAWTGDQLSDASPSSQGEPVPAKDDESVKPAHRKPMYKSLLHRKLRERNAIMHRNMTSLLQQPFTEAQRDLQNASQVLLRSQHTLQETSSLFSLAADTLSCIQNTVSELTTYSSLPNL